MPSKATIDSGPLESAIERLAQKRPIASALRSADWARVPTGLSHVAQMSSGVEKLETMQSIQDKLMEWATWNEGQPEKALMGRGKFVAEMRKEMGALPGDSGKLTDITSERRLSLIYDMQTGDALEYGRHKMAMSPNLLNAWPAYEFKRVASRVVPRPDSFWDERWAEAGGQLFDNRKIALKTDGVWLRLSRFGRPWPPFDYSSGWGLVDVDRAEAVRIGLIKTDERIEATEAKSEFDQGLAASLARLGSKMKSWLKDAFGEQITIKGDTASWTT